SSPSTWDGGAVPGPAQAVSIPANSSIVIDALPHDSLRALRIESGGSLAGSTSMGSLAVGNGVIISENSSLTLPTHAIAGGNSPSGSGAIAQQSQLTVHSAWVNRGTFIAGDSKIT